MARYPQLPFAKEVYACTACALRYDCKKPVPGTGLATARVLAIGTAPNEDDDKTGVPFGGDAGRELLEIYWPTIGIRPDDVYTTHVVKCMPLGSRPPRKEEIAACQSWLAREVEALPALKVIFPLGKVATKAVLGKAHKVDTWAEVSVNGRRLRVFPLPHPAYTAGSPAKRAEVARHLQQVRQILLSTRSSTSSPAA